MPFGSGVHACPGNELAKLQILIFLHDLVSKFRGIYGLITYKLNISIIVSYLIGLCRWEVVGGEGGVEYGPFPIPRNGLLTTFRQHSL
ncbi:hypothetical protein F2Q70_00010150 [Brassica cretica]|uniref:Cytochrome P450 n=1 Tax=Brassica cretica TaxID=69181 RepID=A0A8S9M5Y9_BRACR|nr:hypothetical protein F2Q70_00010150 [Brassica cretica]